MIVGIVILVFGDEIELLGNRSGWAVYHILESIIIYDYVSRTNPKRATET